MAENEFDIEKFSAKLKEKRKQYGYTQEMLAKELGVKKSAISNYENGKSKPRFSTQRKITYILNMDLNEFYNNSLILGVDNEVNTYLKLEDLAKRNIKKAIKSEMVVTEKNFSRADKAWYKRKKKFVLIKYTDKVSGGRYCLVEKNGKYNFAQAIEKNGEKYFNVYSDAEKFTKKGSESYKIIGVVERYYVQF